MEVKKELERCKEVVERILSQNQRARNDDRFLVWKFWHDYDKVNIFIPYEEFCRLTPIESITRARRLVQNELGRYLPDDPAISVRRRIKEEIIRKWFKENQWYISEWKKLKFKIN